GLITPSLDEMVTVAKEMQRQNFSVPLMIGGATTSKAHTAVKIEPNYRNNQVVYVADASRAVGVASQLLSDDHRERFINDVKAEYVKVRERNANRQRRALIPYADAVKRKPPFDWTAYEPPKPTFTGVKIFNDYPLAELADYIDWTPFFISWGLSGKYPQILSDEVVGEAATQLYGEARRLLDEIIANKSLTARAAVGFWPANTVADDDIQVAHGEQV